MDWDLTLFLNLTGLDLLCDLVELAILDLDSIARRDDLVYLGMVVVESHPVLEQEVGL